MGEDWQKNLDEALGGSSVTKVNGVDESELAKAISEPTSGEAPAAPTPNPFADLERDLGPPQDPKGYLDTFTSGVYRNWKSWEATPESLKAVSAELGGDHQKSISFAQSAKATLDEAGDSEWEIRNIRGFDDFLKWSIEKLGEQSINFLGMAGIGLTGGVTGALVARGLISRGAIGSSIELAGKNAATRALLSTGGRSVIPATQAGAIIGGSAAAYVGSTALETANTAQEQFSIPLPGGDRNVNPGVSLTSGALKGLLELYAPLSVAKSFITPGAEIGKTVAGAIGKTMAKEASTEAAQEMIDIAARRYSDPNYNYLGSEAFWRVAESAAAGALVGGVFGGAGEVIKRRKDQKQELEGEAPGTRNTYTSEEVLKKFPGPVTAMRQMMVDPAQPERLMPEVLSQRADEDLLQVGKLLYPARSELSPESDSRQRYFELLEANTDRYILVDPMTNSTGSRLFNATELEQELALRYAQNVVPKVVRVDQKMIQPIGISALVSDLPEDIRSERIQFLPNVAPEEKKAMLADLHQILMEMMATNDDWRKEQSTTTLNMFDDKYVPAYNDLVTRGMRIIPSYGSGFHYNLDVTGDEVTVPMTKRSQQYLLFNPVTGGISNYVGVLKSKINHTGVPLALDMDKFKPGELSAFKAPDDPIFPDEVRFAPWFKGDREQLLDELKASEYWHAEVMRTFMKRGIYLNPSSWVNELITMNPIDPRKMTRTIGGGFGLDSVVGFEDITGKFPEKVDSKLIVEDSASGYEITEDLVSHLRWALPAMDRILNSLGYDKVKVLVTGSEEAELANKIFVFPAEGVIVYNVKSITMMQGLTLRHMVISSLMHELGHIVTYRVYSKLPVAFQQMLQSAYYRGVLAAQMGQDSKVVLEATFTDPSVSMPYYQSFSEWLAEQFKRWSLTSEPGRTAFEMQMKRGMQDIEKFFTRIEKEWGEYVRDNLQYPDFQFSQVMEYIRTIGVEPRQVKGQLIQEALYQQDIPLLDNPMIKDLTTFVMGVAKEMSHMVPKGVKIEARQELEQSNASAAARWVPDLSLIEILVGALRPESARSETQAYISHELVHAYVTLGLFSKEELNVLYSAIKKTGFILPANVPQGVRNIVTRYGEARGWDKLQVEAKIQEMLQEEKLAYFIQQFAETGLAPNEEVASILSRFLEFLEKVRNFLKGNGFTSSNQIIGKFFKGEILRREDRASQKEEVTKREGFWADDVLVPRMNALISADDMPNMVPSKIEEIGNNRLVAVEYVGGKGQNALSAHYRFFQRTNAAPLRNIRDLHRGAKFLGYVTMENRMPKGFDVLMLESNFTSEEGNSGSEVMFKYIVQDLDIQLKPSGVFTPSGFVIARLRFREQAKHYIEAVPPKDGSYPFLSDRAYVSPNFIQEQLDQATTEYKRVKMVGGQTAAVMASKVAFWRDLKSKVPEATWNNPILEQMFAFKDMMWDGNIAAAIQSGTQIEEQKLLQTVTGESPVKQDDFVLNYEQKIVESRMENAKATGTPFQLAAPDSMLSYEASRILDRVFEFDADPKVKKYLKNQKQQIDQIGRFSNMYWGLNQFAWRNEKVPGVPEYLEANEKMYGMGQAWLRRADERAKVWEKRSDESKKKIAEYLFWLTEMNYRSTVEKQTKVVRLPSPLEEFQERNKQKISNEDYAFIQEVRKDFDDFLTEVERVRDLNLLKQFINNPNAYAVAKASLTKEMAELRAKPYFPMVRFGQFTISVRDNKVLKGHWAFETVSQRDAAVADIAAQFPGGLITLGRVPENALEFQSLPAPLLRAVKEVMPNETGQALTAEQLTWIEEFEMANTPDKNFKKRWMANSGVAGYSMDALRVYGHYFMHGSRYLARLAYAKDMKAAISKTEESIATSAAITSKRQQVVQYMKDHYMYVMESGKDYGRFKAFLSVWFLGFSPAAAAMNLFQTPVNLFPHLWHHFGAVKANKILFSVLDAIKATRGLSPGGNARFRLAREQAVNEGLIDIGQAPELGAFAQGYNLNNLMTGSKAQKTWRNISYYGMWMFQQAEQFNREVSFRTAFELALANPTTARVKEIGKLYPIQILDLQTQTGLTFDESLAYLFAKETIQQTQFVYADYAKPRFMRDSKASVVLIFMQYTQNMLYTLRYGSGNAQMFLILAFLYGMKGLPGEEDMNEILAALGQRLFGQDWDLNKKARQFARDLTRGTVFDEIGPDLLLHGISRYGFGMGLLPEGWGAPRFDASANGSMGKIVPGLAELAHGISTYASGKDIIADAAQKATGAGGGLLFGLMNFMNEKPGSVESRKWEVFLPRAVKAGAKAYRYGLNSEGQGAEKTSSGAKIVKFDIRDPDDLATVVAQGLGFSPQKVTQTWDMLRAARDDLKVYQAEKAILYAQMYEAVLAQNKTAIEDVRKAIVEYNERTKKIDPNMQIAYKDLQQAIQGRARAKLMTETFGTPNKREVPTMNRVKDLYPGVVSSQKVK